MPLTLAPICDLTRLIKNRTLVSWQTLENVYDVYDDVEILAALLQWLIFILMRVTYCDFVQYLTDGVEYHILLCIY